MDITLSTINDDNDDDINNTILLVAEPDTYIYEPNMRFEAIPV